MEQIEFLKLIEPFRNKIFRLARRLLVSVQEAEDATQEVYIKLWNKNDGLREYQSVEALAMTMTKNYCLDQLRSKRAGNLSIVHNNYKDREAPLQTQVEDRDNWSWVEKAIASLPEQQQIIVQMRDIEQYDYTEIAEMLQMNETAIRVALSRARKQIREFITKTHAYGIA
ncbi:RNA polymerase sigma factor [Flavobacterium silvaticum]|uniref:RNA polymerase sigma factor n=1 Tax=Flavobacterium silvaticum TaxID=1852020 RepID=A0A972FLW5_9FLAO|nr:RNA polymerase sigma factor [Flavobacterium silvaticum]NMH28143.1 RNA polymerase sigma factor [Flavobacterium silvaticum]